MNWSGISWRHWVNAAEQAMNSLRDNRLRTFLSILGIAVGIAAVMTVGSISKGGHFLVFKELETFGLKSIWISRKDDNKGQNKAILRGTGIEEADIFAVREANFPSVLHLTPVVHTNPQALTIHNGSQYSNAKVIGIDREYLPINSDALSIGVGFQADDVRQRRKVAIIGQAVSDDLFGGNTDIVGKEFRINDVKYTVVGVLESKSRDFLGSIGSGGGGDANNRILVPYSALHAQLGHRDVHTLQAEAVEFDQTGQALQQIVDMLEQRHGKRFAYRAETLAKYIDTANYILQGVSMIGVVAAAISLLVGGMGIMNIISTSVLERTREIGLRKAVGASQQMILLQFLLESVIISVIGGLIGLTLGVVASAILSWITHFPLVPSLGTVLIALLVSIMVGLFSGYYPAQRAAKLRPVVALRYE